MTDIKAYIDMLGLSAVDEGLRFLKVIKALDAVYLTHKSSNSATEKK